MKSYFLSRESNVFISFCDYDYDYDYDDDDDDEDKALFYNIDYRHDEDDDDDLYGNLPMRFTILYIPIYRGIGASYS